MATSWKKDPVTGQLIKVETPITTPTNPYQPGYQPYGQTSVAPKPTTPLSPTQPVATPAPIQPTTPPIGGGVGISPQTQQIQTQIEETKAKIKELQGVKDLMDKGYQVQRPGETANTQPDILSELEQRRTGEFQSYLDFLKGQPSPLETYQTFRTQLGLNEKEQAVAGIQGQVQKTEDMLLSLEQDIAQRSGGFSITSPMLRRQLNVESKPLQKRYAELLTGLRGAEQGLTGSRQQLAQMIGLQQAEQERQAKIAEAGFEYGQKRTPQEETALEIQRKQALAKAFPEAPEIERVGTPSTGVWERQPDGSWKEVIKATKEPTELTATKEFTRVKAIVAQHPGEWGNAADQIDKEFGKGTATKYDDYLKGVYTKDKRMTASTITDEAMTELNDDIEKGATLQQLYEAYAEISPALIQSLYYNR